MSFTSTWYVATRFPATGSAVADDMIEIRLLCETRKENNDYNYK